MQFYFRIILLFEVLPNFLVGNFAICISHHERVFNIYSLASHPHLAKHVVVAALEVVADLKVVVLILDLCFDLAVGVVDDGQEHVEEDEEHKEDIAQKEDGAKDSVRLVPDL